MVRKVYWACLAVILCGLNVVAAPPPERWFFEGTGRLVGSVTRGGVVPLVADVRAFRPGWSSYACLGAWSVTRTRYEPEPSRGLRRWTGLFDLQPGQTGEIHVTATDLADGRLGLTAYAAIPPSVPMEEVHWILELPVRVFRGGRVTLSAGNRELAGILPVDAPAEPRFLGTNAVTRVRIEVPGGPAVDIEFSVPRKVVLQDGRFWNGDTYTLFTPIAARATNGQDLAVVLGCSWDPPLGPAQLTVGRVERGLTFDGMGGNYCFGVNTPETELTLRHLEPAWARVELKADEWEPANDNADATVTDWPRLEAVDKPDSRIRQDLELAARLKERHVPTCLSIWYLPEWLYVDPGRGREVHGRQVARDRWPELAECIVSYIRYAGRQYKWQPDYFSFNEPDFGVRVKLSPEEYRDLLRFLGAQFRAADIQTRFLLGDTTRAAFLVDYVRPAMADPDVMAHVGAVGFHSWGGGTPEEYGRVRGLAAGLGLPLLVSETGYDSITWRTPWVWESWYYAQADLRRIQELLFYTRPRGMMYWEYTADYSLFAGRARGAVAGDPAPTARFWIMRQLLMTPRPALFLATQSDREDVLFTAFEAADPARAGELVLHVANLGGARTARVSGLPAGLRQMERCRTGWQESFRTREPVRVTRGEAEFDLPAQTFTTLTGKTE